MIYNILNGDALASKFGEAEIEGEVIIMREALIDGDVSGETLDEFWKARASYVGATETEYAKKIITEFEKIIQAKEGAEFHLWFEYDLFCQVNMWFIISVINGLPISKKIFAVYTSHLDREDKQFWNGFGQVTPDDLRTCFNNRIPLTDSDLLFGAHLWNAYKHGNREELKRISKNQLSSFPYLEEVVQAHIDRFPTNENPGRPERVIEEILKNGSSDFEKVFTEFWKRESIYGFGDLQVKSLYDKVIKGREQTS
jgi:hypothetical protein